MNPDRCWICGSRKITQIVEEMDTDAPYMVSMIAFCNPCFKALSDYRFKMYMEYADIRRESIGH